jgi:flagellar biosynthesis/type III secretory pathway protein FliH
MSGLLKAQATQAVAAHPVQTGDLLHAEQIASLRQHIATLEAGIDARDARIRQLDEAVVAAREEGERSGQQQATDDSAARLARLESTLPDLQAELAARFAGIETLAAALARDSLDRLFTETDDRSALVVDLIRGQMARIEAETVMTVEVSALDFTAETVRALPARLSLESLHCVRRDDLESGACQLGLRLGRIELGIAQQWGALATLLGELAGAERMP